MLGLLLQRIEERLTQPSMDSQILGAVATIACRPWKLSDSQEQRPAAAQQEQSWLSGSGGSANKAEPAPDALQVYLYGISQQDIAAAAGSLKLGHAIALTEHIHEADAILALRSRVKQVRMERGLTFHLTDCLTSGIPGVVRPCVLDQRSCPLPPQGDWVRTVAKQDGIPVYALKRAGRSSLVRGLRTLLGVDPSAGSLFGQAANEDKGIVTKVRHTPAHL